MIDQLATQRLLGAFRGEARRRPRRAGRRSLGRPRRGRRRAPDVASVDVNPLIVDGRRRADRRRRARRARRRRSAPTSTAAPTRRRRPSSSRPCSSRAACSSPAPRRTPASSGSCRCTTCSPAATRARVFGTNLQGEEVLGIRTVADVADLPDGEIDLVFVCTPAVGQPRPAAGLRGEGRQGGVPHVGRLRRGGRGGQAGRGRAGRPRRRARASCSPGRTARASSARRSSCAPRSSPRTRRPAASASPARAATSCPASSTTPGPTGVGISRAVSAGNAAAVIGRRLPRLLRRRPGDGGRAGLRRGHHRRPRRCSTASAGAAARKPLVLVKGGATEGGARAAASHTGALAADDKVFDGECRAAGITRAATVEEAFEAAATFATQPLAGRARTSSC